jgi:CRP-like cAMP-binding protein
MPLHLTALTLPSGNRLLDALPDADYADIALLLESHPLRIRETLQEAGDSAEFVYFPTSGIVSLLTVLENGSMIEFATVGREGTTGVPSFLGIPPGATAIISQLDGDSLRMSVDHFDREILARPPFAEIVRKYAGALFALAAQSAACNRAHGVAERCARWLLMTHDQARRDEFAITQEFLAQMLGVGRSRVTEVAGTLQEWEIIRYHRGLVTILDRERLEQESCECYRVVRQHLDGLGLPPEKLPFGRGDDQQPAAC